MADRTTTPTEKVSKQRNLRKALRSRLRIHSGPSPTVLPRPEGFGFHSAGQSLISIDCDVNDGRLTKLRAKDLKTTLSGDLETPKKGFLSPFRYPGGKTWFRKTSRKWLKNRRVPPRILVEPFAGGAAISLAAVHENLVPRAAFAELDPEVANTWESMLNGEAEWLIDQITSFQISRSRVKKVLSAMPPTKRDRAFRCILQNRTARGGVIAEGAGIIRKGENGKGVSSRWYPETLAKRIRVIHSLKAKLSFMHGDGFKLIHKYLNDNGAVFFVDPPYTQAARRLYRHWEIDHEELFKLLSRTSGDVLMTYDDTSEIRDLATEHGFQFKRISMRTTHHEAKSELMISKNFDWQKPPRPETRRND